MGLVREIGGLLVFGRESLSLGEELGRLCYGVIGIVMFSCNAPSVIVFH